MKKEDYVRKCYNHIMTEKVEEIALKPKKPFCETDESFCNDYSDCIIPAIKLAVIVMILSALLFYFLQYQVFKMIVLSLFDGMGCGYEALKRAGVPVTKYYASEIDEYAIKIAKKNHPDTIK